MDEFDIIRQYFDRKSSDDSVIVGIGDDGAVTRPIVGRDHVTVIDTLVAGIHFPVSMSAADIGYRAVAVNLSDIAAMAAVPKYMTLALTLDRADPEWLGGFAQGLFSAADEFGVALIGGDTTRGNDLVVTVQITGDVIAGKALLRSGAGAGDSIYVTGKVGDAAAGLSILQSSAPQNDITDYLVDRFSRPRARVTFAQAIAPLATAAIDLSDGLFTDVEKLLSSSDVSGKIEIKQLPMSSQLLSIMAPEDALRFALGGGDDYELCFTTAAKEESINALIGDLDVTVTRIGSVATGSGLICISDGDPFDYHDDGYRHFR